MTFSKPQTVTLRYKAVGAPGPISDEIHFQQNYDVVEEDGSKLKPLPAHVRKFYSLRHFLYCLYINISYLLQRNLVKLQHSLILV